MFDYVQLLMSISLVSLIVESMSIPNSIIARLFESLLTNLRKITFFLSFGGNNPISINLFMTCFYLIFGLELNCDKAAYLQSGVTNPSILGSSRRLQYPQLCLGVLSLPLVLSRSCALEETIEALVLIRLLLRS